MPSVGDLKSTLALCSHSEELLHPSRYWKRGAEVVGAGLLERPKDEQRRGEAPSEDASESVHLRRLSEEESWIKGTAVPGVVR